MNLVVNGVLLQYRQTGDSGAPVVLLLHGWGANAKSFDGLAAGLSREYRVIQLDLPGHGGSEIPPTTWGVSEYAGLVRDFVAKADFAPVYAIGGHSFGGRIAMKLVTEKLLVPTKLVLLDSAGVKPAGSARNQGFKLAAKVGKAATALPLMGRLRSRLRRRLYQAAGSTDYLEAGPMRQIFLNTIAEDQLSVASAIQVPTLLVWGADDADTPVSDAQKLSDKIAGSKLEVIPGAGHFVFLDKPAEVLAAVEKFLS
jgi:pimeloyl-ACP methyl ester carboxylesterase